MSLSKPLGRKMVRSCPLPALLTTNSLHSRRGVVAKGYYDRLVTSEQSQDVSAAEQPLLRVVRGAPTDEELAALIAVVAARRAEVGAEASADARAMRASGWTDRSRGLREPHRPGPHGWRAAAQPR